MSTRRKRIPSALDALMPYLKACICRIRRAFRPAERLNTPQVLVFNQRVPRNFGLFWQSGSKLPDLIFFIQGGVCVCV